MSSTASIAFSRDFCMALDACPGFVWVLAGRHQWSFINQAARDYLGTDKASKWASAVHEEDLGVLISALEQAWDEATPTCEVRVRSSHGTWRTIRHQFRRDAATGCVVGFGYDVTELRNAEKQLLQRQRYQAAVAMAYRIVAMGQENSQKMSQLEEIAGQALDVEKVAFWPLAHPGDWGSLRKANHGKTREQLQQFFDRIGAPSTIQALQAGRTAEPEYDGPGQLFIVPLMSRNQCVALTELRVGSNRQLGRTELDFLNNLAGLLPAL